MEKVVACSTCEPVEQKLIVKAGAQRLAGSRHNYAVTPFTLWCEVRELMGASALGVDDHVVLEVADMRVCDMRQVATAL